MPLDERPLLTARAKRVPSLGGDQFGPIKDARRAAAGTTRRRTAGHSKTCRSRSVRFLAALEQGVGREDSVTADVLGEAGAALRISTGSRAARQTRKASSNRTTTAASKSQERKTESSRSPRTAGWATTRALTCRRSLLGREHVPAPLRVWCKLTTGRTQDKQFCVVGCWRVAGPDNSAAAKFGQDRARKRQQLADTNFAQVHPRIVRVSRPKRPGLIHVPIGHERTRGAFWS